MSVTIQPSPRVSVIGQRAFASYLSDAVIGDAVGTADGDRCVGEPPSARYFLGALAPGDLDLSAGRHLRGRETANNAGFDFEVSDANGAVAVGVALSLYYRVFPKLDEQLRISGEQARGAEENFPIAVVFKRTELPLMSISVPLGGDPLARHGQEAITEAIDAVRCAIAQDPMVYRRSDPRRAQAERVPGTELVDESRFTTWCESLVGDAVLPDWKVYVSVRTRTTAAGTTRVSLRVVNDSSDPTVDVPGRRRGTMVRRHDDDRDHFVFRTLITVKPRVGQLQQIRMNLGADAYRYDPNLPAYASNCGVECELDAEQNILELRSTWAPRWNTYRIESRPDASTDFCTLDEHPIEALEALAGRLDEYVDSPVWSVRGLPAEQVDAKRRDREAFRREVRRFRAGVRWLQQDERLLLAFRLANRTMTRVGTMSGAEYSGWYLFQLVFIVSQLPALAWREHPPQEFELMDGVEDPTAIASVLWFPTGGGKTEAYLGLAACAMFYDRARGKKTGVTAWCRLPLRLLTLQATQRQVAFVAAADEIRKEASDEITAVGGDPGARFQVGVFMGDTNTPNSISRDPATVRLLRDDAERRNRYRVVDKCPYCRARAVSISPPDPKTLRLVHACTDCGRDIPVIVTDNEIYRYLPAFVVGTVDKLATMGLTDKFGALLGDVDGECTIHGFGRGGKCVERRVPDHPKGTWRALARPLYDASPSLEILDELHMLREEFGVFDGHYESGLANIQRELSSRARTDGRGVRMKVVATTATIKGEDRQCDHLFGLPSVAMPLPGPRLDESFYWTLQEEPLRQFIGILPQRTTSEQALVRILLAFHKSVRRLDSQGQSADARFETLHSSEFEALLHLYRVSLTYVTSLLDFGKLSRSVETQVNHDLRRLGLREVKAARISADAAKDGIGAIRAIVDDLEKPADESAYEAVLATAMVAHGVDIDRLNVMIFNGMPKSMAEYIQASSRVGRKYLGVIFTVFNPVRERDRSHFRYHGKFHEYLDRMVEPVAINRWSRYAARRTFPGILMSEILQNGNRVWWDTGHSPRHLHDLSQAQQASRPLANGGIPALQERTLVASMESAFLAMRPEAVELRGELPQWTRTALATIRAAGAGGVVRGNGRGQYRATGDHLGLAYAPMTSLRDVEEDVPIVVLDRRAR